jgi:predicted O-linked N-acetylglucosamine transferase (SPINDLY family)
MDVRALKTLYTPGSGSGSGSVAGTGAGRPASPASPTAVATAAMTDSGVGVFSVEAFAQRVQALISDDRALMERLIRFAQAHDLLKKNAERAQKLAQESNAALETYQRQVRTLEEHIARADGWYVQCSLSLFFFFCVADRGYAPPYKLVFFGRGHCREDKVDQLSAEKLTLEERAAEQAETLRDLTNTNTALSARALQLAQDAAAAQEELRTVAAASEREQVQRLALLEEINLVQTENGSLRQQLRALGKL